MSTSREGLSGKRVLEGLGIRKLEEQVYRWLLIHGASSAEDIAGSTALGESQALSVLASLENLGLATHTPDRPRRFLPASPDIALEAMCIKRERELQDVRRGIGELQTLMAASNSNDEEQVVELVTNREMERQILEKMHGSAQFEVIVLARPPIRITRVDLPREKDRKYEIDNERRGVSYRSIVDHEIFDIEGAMRVVQADIENGQDVRISKGLPLKMVMIDRRIALIPLNLQEKAGPSLLVRTSALVDALYALVELLWEQSSPIAFGGGGFSEGKVLGMDDNRKNLISLMAAGLNDKKISAELNITTRTIQRRLNDLMEELGASTRFQAGWLAALRFIASDLISVDPKSQK